jgi:lipopolysaccharide biosynthesis glycosyltransferase
VAWEQSRSAKLEISTAFAIPSAGRHALLRSRQVPTEDKSSQAPAVNFDRVEAGHVAERAASADAVHVACCFDRKMELPFLVLASSLKRHLTGDRKVILHAFHSDPIAHDLAYFVRLNSATFELRLRPIANRFQGPVTWPSHLTAATLLRLLLPLVLKDIDRVVYLDCDLIVLNDIATLYDTDLSGFPLAACLDFWLTGAAPFAPPGWDVEAWHEFLNEVVSLADWKTYFNAGVLVMDLKRFRNTGLVHAAGEFLEQTNYKTPFVDQEALNHVIDGAFVRLDPRWNVLAALGHSNPWVIHFAGPNKPWSCEGRPIPFWNRRFWQEAAESAVLPLLVRAYLETCDRRGLSRLQPAAVLLSSGKPRVCQRDIVAHAEKFRSFTEAAQASESLARDLDRRPETTDADAALVAVDVVNNRCGRRDGETLIFDLKAADGYLVFGPCLWYPAGNYEATFNLAVSRVAPDQTSKLVIDIVDDTDRCLAQRDLSAIPSVAESTLRFVVDRSELFLAFRVFAKGFAGGELRFGGVTLRPH